MRVVYAAIAGVLGAVSAALCFGMLLGGLPMKALAAPARCCESLPVSTTLSNQARAQLATMSKAATGARLSVAQMRAVADRAQATIAAAQRKTYDVTIQDSMIVGVPVRIITPAARAPDPERVLIDLHGGGFEVDSGSLTENIPIAALTGMRVVAVLYRLSPEHHFPAPVDDALAVYRALSRKYAPDHIGIYGTSAGAILGPELIARIISDGIAVPAALGVFSGDADLARPGDSERLFPVSMGGETLKDVIAAYAGKTELTDPLISPLYGGLKGFPATLCVTSERDVLLSGTADFCRRLGEAGVESNTVVFDGLSHAFWSYLIAPESDEAFETMARFFERRLGAPRGHGGGNSLSSTFGSTATPRASAARCEALSTLALDNTTITAALAVPAGPFKDPSMAAAVQLPAHCRIEGSISPEPGSDIRFEVWMPMSGWNGRLFGAGNGGLGGTIAYATGLLQAIQRGAAGVSTDTGHETKLLDGAEDGSWALGHPARIVDYGYRAVHLSALAAKNLVAAFYGEPAKHAYFASCSNGGRQALMEAQRYPGDYDGIIAGAPAFNFTGVVADLIWNTQAQEAPGAAIPASKIPALQAAVRKACPRTDLMKGDPLPCRFHPQVLLCRDGENDFCLTPSQVAALSKIYAGPHNSRGIAIYPGFPATGDEVGTLPGWGWGDWIVARAPEATHGARLAAALLADFGMTAKTDIRHFDFDHDYAVLKAELGPILDATDPDLSAFSRRGGKLILWHGWADQALPPQQTISYFNAVRARMGNSAADEVLRLYMAPGVTHCFGGPGGNSFGQVTAPPRPEDPRYDMSAALERWVERKIPPGPIVAHKAENALAAALDWRLAKGHGTTLLCPYPQIATYAGEGERNSAGSYRCKTPQRIAHPE